VVFVNYTPPPNFIGSDSFLYTNVDDFGLWAVATVNVTITSDNAYSFGFGTAAGLTSLFGGVENCTAGEIFNCTGGPETYSVTAQAGDYLLVPYL
jgi:hypothetical protein